MQFTKKYQHS